MHRSILDFQAVIFDTDGVVTDTASLHAAAWKRTFDAFLQARAERLGEAFRPFTDEDYRRYVDGKPRYDGVASFLQSRGITIPYGDPQDPPERETVCGIGNRKNRDFLIRLAEGVEPYPSTVELVHRLRRSEVRTAVISASENCAEVLEAAGVSDLFDVRVDGRDASRLDLRGKPDPAIFIEAARRLGVDPSRTVVVEDALAGVEAGRRGGFGLVVAVDRSGHPEALREQGADVVVGDLGELEVIAGEPPSALSEWEAVARRLRRAQAVVFLDYDGTLTPIVERPEDALLSPDARSVLSNLAEACPVAIISGRDLSDVRAKVGVEGILYAGSHGFDIAAPPDLELESGPAFDEFLPLLDAAQAQLEGALSKVAGARVERKRFSIAVHYRQVEDEAIPLVEAAVDRAAARHPELRKSTGKKVFELRPDVAWDKGAALLWLLGRLGLDRPHVVPIYLGDDTTDEDAFRAIQDRGIGIIVGEVGGPTAAGYSLADPAEVGVFLGRLLTLIRAA